MYDLALVLRDIFGHDIINNSVLLYTRRYEMVEFNNKIIDWNTESKKTMVLISLALTIITRWTLLTALFRVAKILRNRKKSQCITKLLHGIQCDKRKISWIPKITFHIQKKNQGKSYINKMFLAWGLTTNSRHVKPDTK